MTPSRHLAQCRSTPADPASFSTSPRRPASANSPSASRSSGSAPAKASPLAPEPAPPATVPSPTGTPSPAPGSSLNRDLLEAPVHVHSPALPIPPQRIEPDEPHGDQNGVHDQRDVRVRTQRLVGHRPVGDERDERDREHRAHRHQRHPGHLY